MTRADAEASRERSWRPGCGWSWYDLAGNCRLEIPGVLLIERSDNEPVRAGRVPGPT